MITLKPTFLIDLDNVNDLRPFNYATRVKNIAREQLKAYEYDHVSEICNILER